jgi:hypothetical protein
MTVREYIDGLPSLPAITGLALGRSRFRQYRKTVSSNSVGSFSRRDILRLDLIFLSERCLDFLAVAEEAATFLETSFEEGSLRRLPRGLFFDGVSPVN